MTVMARHPAVLVTGMSGVGKSTVLAELAGRGYATVDTDDDGWIEVIDGEPLWREPLIKALLDRPRGVPLFVQGTVANQWHFYDRFDAIILLSAPIDVLLQRIDRRTNKPRSANPRGSGRRFWPTSPRWSHCCGRRPPMRSAPIARSLRSSKSWPVSSDHSPIGQLIT